MKKIFDSYDALITDLRQKAERYPLITKMYIPVIENHQRGDKKNDADDWLQLLYFQHLYFSTDPQKGSACRKRLQQVEDDLSRIKEVLGNEKFEILCQDLLPFVKHPTINGVHDKILQFYCELKGILYFGSLGYKVQRIPRKTKGEHADLKIEKGQDSGIVECKFIPAPCTPRTFIMRRIRFLSNFPEINTLKPWDKFSYSVNWNKDLGQQDLVLLKNFVDAVFDKNPSEDCYETEIFLKAKIRCEQEKSVISDGVNIDCWVQYLEKELHSFYGGKKVSSVLEKARKQVKSSSVAGDNSYIYLFVELDPAYQLPFEEMDKAKRVVLENFRREYGKEVEIILETWPPSV